MHLYGEEQEAVLVTICANCHMVKDEAGRWVVPAPSFNDLPPHLISHGICPACIERYYMPMH